MNKQFSLLRPFGLYFDANSGGGSGGTNDPSPDGDNKPKGKTFTQEELDALFTQRATQAKTSALSELFKEIGVENADTLKAIITKAKEADDAQKTELQKAQDKANAADKALADQKTAHETALAELEKRIQDSEIKITAGSEVTDKDGKVIRPRARADALDVILLSVERKDIAKKDNAYTGIEEALDALFKAKPFLFEDEQAIPIKGSPTDNKLRKPNKPKSNLEDDEKPFFNSL
ncbi:MAG: hypothetical protein PHQ36_04195 [Anaerolineales bacterium]|nr:hypothetical protein [Anaerolineales bacterium]